MKKRMLGAGLALLLAASGAHAFELSSLFNQILGVFRVDQSAPAASAASNAEGAAPAKKVTVPPSPPLGEMLDTIPFGKAADAVVDAGAAKDVDEDETCSLPEIKRFYRDHDMSCRWLLMKAPYVVAGVPFQVVLITNGGERVVAVSLRRVHRLSFAQRPEEMDQSALQRASEDRDHMLARNELYVRLGGIAAPVGRDSLSERPGLRAVDHYFRGVKFNAVFNERLTPQMDRFVINVFPSSLGEPNRSVFVPAEARSKYFGGDR